MRDGDIDYYKRDEAIDDWVQKMAIEFHEDVASPLELAMDIYETCHPKETVNALCFINYTTNNYQKEVEEAFDEYLEKERLSQYD